MASRSVDWPRDRTTRVHVGNKEKKDYLGGESLHHAPSIASPTTSCSASTNSGWPRDGMSDACRRKGRTTGGGGRGRTDCSCRTTKQSGLIGLGRRCRLSIVTKRENSSGSHFKRPNNFHRLQNIHASEPKGSLAPIFIPLALEALIKMPTVITYIMRIFSRGSPDDEGVKTVPLRSACQSLPGKVLRWTVPRPDEADPSHIGAESSTSRVDGGRDAWCFLLVCFIVEALVWGEMLPRGAPVNRSQSDPCLPYVVTSGFPFAFGVFQDHYRTHELFANSSNIAVIGTCALVSSEGRDRNQTEKRIREATDN